jgi:hypothetical protein
VGDCNEETARKSHGQEETHHRRSLAEASRSPARQLQTE